MIEAVFFRGRLLLIMPINGALPASGHEKAVPKDCSVCISLK